MILLDTHVLVWLAPPYDLRRGGSAVARHRERRPGAGRDRRHCHLAAGLRGFRGDPADRLIGATAILHEATLVTADQALLRWRGGPKLLDATK
jgi:PIN domain nuclease of toxin-antitoxin system